MDGAIHRGAGPKLLEETRALGGCQTGEARITAGYNLPARHVIHAVGPVWHGGKSSEDALLASCYLNSLGLAVENGVKTIAFPSISTGVYRFPIDRASRIALGEIRVFLANDSTVDKVICCAFNKRDHDVYMEAACDVIG